MDTERRNWLWPVGLAACLCFMIGVCLAFYAVAASYPDAEVVPDAFAGGLAYNSEVRSQRAALERGLALELTAHEAAQGARVEVVLRDASGRAIRPDSVSVRRERTTQGGYDADFELESVGSTTSGLVPLPLPGRWRLTAVASLDGHSLRRSIELQIGGAR